MNLFSEWEKRLKNESVTKTEWDRYLGKETDFYIGILSQYKDEIDGECILEVSTSISKLVATYGVDDVEALGLLDGINESLVEELDLKEVGERSESDGEQEEEEISFVVDFRKLYQNMLKVKAEWLSTLDEWEDILSEKERQSLKTAFYEEHRAKSQKLAGRNDPCPCGSGKKYKKCCGKE